MESSTPPTNKDASKENLDQAEQPKQAAPIDVIVVGGGPAGLVAAYELERSGLSVQLLEARERLGGRVLSHAMGQDQIAEAGAEYIDHDQERVNHYINAFGLARQPARSLYDRALLEGHLHTFRAPDKDLLPSEIAGHMPSHLYSFDIEEHYFKPLWKSAAAQAARNGVVGEDAIWDALIETSIADVLDATGADLSVRSYLRMRIVPDEGVELDQVPATQFADGGWPDMDGEGNLDDESFQLEGGNARLIDAFAASIQGDVLLDAIVRKVKQHKEGVTVTYERSGDTHEISASYIVLATPVGPLRKIEFSPTFSKARKEAMAAVSYAPVLKVLMQFEGRPWVDCGWNGYMTTDHPLCVWHATEHQPGDAGILCFYATAGATLQLRQMTEPKRDAFLLDILRSQGLLPPDCQPIATKTFDWPGETLSGGGWIVYPLGEEDELREILAAPEGRCYFAGEHIPEPRSDEEDLLNTIESALSSGMAAARSILKLRKKAPTQWKRSVLTPASQPTARKAATPDPTPAGSAGGAPEAPQEAELIVDAIEDSSFWQALGQPAPTRVKVATPAPVTSQAAPASDAAPASEAAPSPPASSPPQSAPMPTGADEGAPSATAEGSKEPKVRASGKPPQAAGVFEMIGGPKKS